MYIQGQVGLTGNWYLWCVNTSDCFVKWKYLLGSQPPGIFIHSSCGISHIDGTIYVGYKEALYAIKPDGSLKWKYDTGGNVESSPTVDDVRGVVYIGSNAGKIYAIHTTGG